MSTEKLQGGQQAKQAAISSDAQLCLVNVNKVYETDKGQLIALDNVNLEIKKGEVFGIIGRSGAGKSTLIRCINMLESPSSGEIWVGGQSMTSLNSRDLRNARGNIGMIFQHFNLLSSRTVFGNIAFPLELKKMPKEQIKERVMSLIELVGLTEHTDKYVAQISGGQKQRVGIARALASNPKVLLSDEATSALDPETTSATLSLLKRLNTELGLTIVLITHQMEVVRRICDRVAVLERGKVIEEGLVRNVFAYPKTETTKALVSEATGQALPKETLNALVAQAQPDTCIWLIRGHQPDAITQLVKLFDLDIEILQALVEDYQGIAIGSLLLKVHGPQQARQGAVQWLEQAGVELEEIYSE